MSPQRATLLATVLLAGCGGAARGGSAGAGGPSGGDGDGARVAADAPQSAFVARFPEGRNEYWCQWVEEAGYSADKEFTPIEITAASVKLHPTGETTHFDHFVEYPIDSGDAAYVGERGYSGEQRSVVLADGVLYVLASPAEGGARRRRTHLIGRAATGPLRRAQVAAGARVHRADQLKPGGKLRAPRRPRNGDRAVFQGLAQRLQRGPGELGQLIEEQHTMVRQRNLARSRRRATPHQRHGAGSVVRAGGGALGPAIQ